MGDALSEGLNLTIPAQVLMAQNTNNSFVPYDPNEHWGQLDTELSSVARSLEERRRSSSLFRTLLGDKLADAIEDFYKDYYVEAVALSAAAHSGPAAPFVYAGVKQSLSSVVHEEKAPWDNWSWKEYGYDAASYGLKPTGSGFTGAVASTATQGAIDHVAHEVTDGEVGQSWSWRRIGVETLVNAGIQYGESKVLEGRDLKTPEAYKRAQQKLQLGTNFLRVGATDILAKEFYSDSEYRDYKAQNHGTVLERSVRSNVMSIGTSTIERDYAWDADKVVDGTYAKNAWNRVSETASEAWDAISETASDAWNALTEDPIERTNANALSQAQSANIALNSYVQNAVNQNNAELHGNYNNYETLDASVAQRMSTDIDPYAMQNTSEGLLSAQPRNLTDAEILAMMQEPEMKPAPDIDRMSQEVFGEEGHNYLEDTLSRIDQQYSDELLLLQQAQANLEAPMYEFDIGNEFVVPDMYEEKGFFSNYAERLRNQYDINEQSLEYMYQGNKLEQAVAGFTHIPMQGVAALQSGVGFALGMVADSEYRSNVINSVYDSVVEVGSAVADGDWQYFVNGFEQQIENTGNYFENRGLNYIVSDVVNIGVGVASGGAGIISRSTPKFDVDGVDWSQLPSVGIYGAGDVYSSEFIGPVNWKTFYRGDSTQRSSFNSTYSEVNGLDATYEFMDSLNAGQRRDIQRDHAVSSQYSPTISLTSNKDVATFFATSGGKQSGYVTTFRFDASNPNRVDPNMPYYNFDNRYNMEIQNPELGTSEFEFLADVKVPNRNIYSQEKVGLTRTSNGSFYTESEFGLLTNTVEPAALSFPQMKSGHHLANSVTEGGTGRAVTGHGSHWEQDGYILVPEGSYVTLPRPDIAISDVTGQYMERGDWDGLIRKAQSSNRVARDLEGMTTWLPGAEVPNYTLSQPTDLNIYSRSSSVDGWITLDNILAPQSGGINWTACTTQMTKKE